MPWTTLPEEQKPFSHAMKVFSIVILILSLIGAFVLALAFGDEEYAGDEGFNWIIFLTGSCSSFFTFWIFYAWSKTIKLSEDILQALQTKISPTVMEVTPNVAQQFVAHADTNEEPPAEWPSKPQRKDGSLF